MPTALCSLCAQVQVPGGSLALWLFVRVVLPDQSCCCSDRQWESGQPRSSSGGVWVSFIFFFFWGLFWGLFWGGGDDRRAGRWGGRCGEGPKLLFWRVWNVFFIVGGDVSCDIYFVVLAIYYVLGYGLWAMGGGKVFTACHLGAGRGSSTRPCP